MTDEGRSCGSLSFLALRVRPGSLCQSNLSKFVNQKHALFNKCVQVRDH